MSAILSKKNGTSKRSGRSRRAPARHRTRAWSASARSGAARGWWRPTAAPASCLRAAPVLPRTVWPSLPHLLGSTTSARPKPVATQLPPLNTHTSCHAQGRSTMSRRCRTTRFPHCWRMEPPRMTGAFYTAVVLSVPGSAGQPRHPIHLPLFLHSRLPLSALPLPSAFVV